jgi:nitroreductase
VGGIPKYPLAPFTLPRYHNHMGESNLNPELNYIYRRRSIRKYLLKAAMAAPTARNAQGWRFIVVDKREDLDALAEHYPNAGMLREATMCIVPVGDANDFYHHQNLAAATQNILLAAPALGLGTCWCGVNPDRHGWAHEFFGVPEGWWVFALIAVGYPLEAKPPNTWHDPAKVFHGRWGIGRE